jgi:hypothetical protein
MPTVVLKSILTPAAASLQTSTVGEPSVSSNAKEVLYSGNWYAAHSVNSGATWALINPYTFFPPAAAGFCCDQTLIFIPKIGVHVWILQYVKGPAPSTTNVLRIAFKANTLGTPTGWKWWDFVPGNFDPAWAKDWFDYNHCAFSDHFLYVGTNMFSATDTFTRAVMFRIPLGAFSTGTLTVQRFATTTSFSLRCVQGASTDMYFAAHQGANALRIFRWPDAGPLTSKVVPVTAWNGATPYGPVGPGASNWIGRCDGRITGGWITGTTLGFMWSANKQGTRRPYPFIRVARINSATMTLVDEPDIWSSSTAAAYPDAYPNTQGVVGITMFAGGGTMQPAHYVGTRTPAATSWSLLKVAQSTHSPTQPKWGDYLTVRRDNPDTNLWVASGYTLQGGGGIANITPHFVRFKL